MESYSHHFSPQNIPFGIGSSTSHPSPQAVTRIANTVIFLHDVAKAGHFSEIEGLPQAVFDRSVLNDFASLGRSIHQSVRIAIQKLREAGTPWPDGSTEEAAKVAMHLPVWIGDFTDFSSSLNHVKNAGRIVMNNDAPPPSFFHHPVCYAGRASSVVVSGTPIQRPIGQFYDRSQPPGPNGKPPITCGPSRAVDYEMEFAAIVGKPLAMNQGLTVKEADEHIFGFVIVNDWSSRDIQSLEMIPLGPFNGKNFGTSLSPWVVTVDALSPFQTKGLSQEPPIAPYLVDPENLTYSVDMEVDLLIAEESTTVTKSNTDVCYWNIRQMITHVVSAGSGLRTGDLIAIGTISGPERASVACLMEYTEGGKNPLELPGGMKRAYLEDGDMVRITAIAGQGDSGVGFGECIGQLLPSRQLH